MTGMTDTAHADEPLKHWQDFVKVVQIESTLDGTMQPSIVFLPEADKPVPLLVSLHTWSGNYTQSASGRAAWCRSRDWAFIHPDFRGPNRRFESTGSELVVQDILDAVAYVQNQIAVDTSRIYIIGHSGGGHAALLMAGRAPHLWAGVSASCGITDLKKWHAQNPGYGRSIQSSVGGNPQEDENAAEECARRSPVTWLANARAVPVNIKAGINDGHPGTGSVPISHSLEAFNLLADPADKLSAEEIESLTRDRIVPEKLRAEDGAGKLLGRRFKIIFQRRSGNAGLTIYDAGHSGVDDLDWLAAQTRGQPAVWHPLEEGSAPNIDDGANVGK